MRNILWNANSGDVCFSCGKVLEQDELCEEVEGMMDEIVCQECYEKYGVN